MIFAKIFQENNFVSSDSDVHWYFSYLPIYTIYLRWDEKANSTLSASDSQTLQMLLAIRSDYIKYFSDLIRLGDRMNYHQSIRSTTSASCEPKKIVYSPTGTFFRISNSEIMIILLTPIGKKEEHSDVRVLDNAISQPSNSHPRECHQQSLQFNEV